MIRYAQFNQVLTKKAIDAQKAIIRKSFAQYDERRKAEVHKPEYIKEGLLYKVEVKKMLGAIAKANNNQSENYMQDFDKD